MVAPKRDAFLMTKDTRRERTISYSRSAAQSAGAGSCDSFVTPACSMAFLRNTATSTPLCTTKPQSPL